MTRLRLSHIPLLPVLLVVVGFAVACGGLSTVGAGWGRRQSGARVPGNRKLDQLGTAHHGGLAGQGSPDRLLNLHLR